MSGLLRLWVFARLSKILISDLVTIKVVFGFSCWIRYLASCFVPPGTFVLGTLSSKYTVVHLLLRTLKVVFDPTIFS